eukprot:gene5139-10274_t
MLPPTEKKIESTAYLFLNNTKSTEEFKLRLRDIFGKNSYIIYLLCFLSHQSCSAARIGAGGLFSTSKRGKDVESEEVPVSFTSAEKPTEFDETQRRIWVFGPKDLSNKSYRRYGLPSRFVMGLRKELDYIILPGGHEPTKEYVEFLISILGLNKNQVIWTSGANYRLDDDVDENIQNQLKSIISSTNDPWLLIPYCTTSSFTKWATKFINELNVKIFGESNQWMQEYGHKGILHRHMSNLSNPSIIELIDPKIPVPKGYYCKNIEELRNAYILLNTTEVVIKPIHGCSGEGIEFISTANNNINIHTFEYSFPMGDIVLEEKLHLDVSEDGVVISPAVHYMSSSLIGKDLVDQIMQETTWMGWRESVVSSDFANEVYSITNKLLKYTLPQGPGGYDFLSVDGKPILVDINTGRFNGAHQPKIFLEMYTSSKSHWYCWKFSPHNDMKMKVLWEKLVEKGIAFIPGVSTEGMFPLTHLRGIMGLYISIANTIERAMEIYNIANNILIDEYERLNSLDINTNSDTSQQVFCNAPPTTTTSTTSSNYDNVTDDNLMDDDVTDEIVTAKNVTDEIEKNIRVVFNNTDMSMLTNDQSLLDESDNIHNNNLLDASKPFSKWFRSRIISG